jgi:hypothetical protein
MPNARALKSFCSRCLLLLLISASCVVTLAQQAGQKSADGLWEHLDKDKVEITANIASVPVLPQSFEAFRLDFGKLNKLLSPARLSGEGACGGTVLTLPLPDGSYPNFCVQESSIMEPKLAVQYPDIKTYRGQGIADPAMTVRAERTPTGLHAIVLTPDKTYYIDPLPRRGGDLSTYLTYSHEDAPSKPFQCLVSDDPSEASRPAGNFADMPPVTSGDVLRTYRLAVAATGEYTKSHGGTVTGAFTAIVTTVNRVNAMYERELAIQMVLVGDEKSLIFTDPNTDGYTNNNSDKLLAENQDKLDQLIGENNYDIGHVFSTAGGGKAMVGVVGRNKLKAKGETGTSSPSGQFFDVDYVAHEVGHQFGANHTFNGTTGFCSGNRHSATAFEPGSGSTIMGYAGICDNEGNLQPHTDAVFHAASLYEIVSYVTGDAASNVGVKTPINNTITSPPVGDGVSYTVPKGTPFVLTAKQYGDPSFTYAWEEMDTGKEAPPDDDIADARPVFRSFPPSKEVWRIFPKMASLLSGASQLGEAVPSRQRDMNFRVTVRNNRSGGGGFIYGTVKVTVTTDSGPFEVKQPAAGAAWTANSAQTVKWEPAGTSEAPVSCKNVRISISTDGGKTFTVLAPSVPNDGSAVVTVPAVTTASARIKVEAADNVFFNVSTGNFRIVPAAHQ